MNIRPAERGDMPVIMELIRCLAEYEKLLDKMTVTEAFIEGCFFCDHPHAACFIGEADGEIVGFSVVYKTVSTFLGTYGLNIHDLFIRPEFRGKGYGKIFMRYIAQQAYDRGYQRIEWEALDWNTSAIDFYKSLGANLLNDWVLLRLEGEGIKKLASGT